MCIALFATSHPKYALIVLDNRDEYVLRPTSRPSWWTHKDSGHQILSSRDLLREERGTWMGITKQGRLAVLTNYREKIDDAEHPAQGIKSRGGMVTAWLGAPPEENLEEFVNKMLEGRMVKGVGGFSLICGDLKRTGERDLKPLAIISNRSEAAGGVPWIGGERDKVWGLSNTVYAEPPEWPKIINGKQLLGEAIKNAVEQDVSEDELVEALFSVLDTDTLPREPGQKFNDILESMRHSIFIPAVEDAEREQHLTGSVKNGKMKTTFDKIEDETHEVRKQDPAIFDTGPYGTQRQTIILVDFDGNIVYVERALWDKNGNNIRSGDGSVTFRFRVEE